MALIKEFNKAINSLSSFFDLSSFYNSNPKISANIICKNNHNSLETCLNSIKDCVDELIIIDTGSTDGSIEFLDQYLAKNFKEFKFIKENDFKGYSYHRNQAIKESTGNWILVLDSDEFLSSAMQTKLRKLCSTKIYSGYKIYRRWINKISEDSVRYIFTKEFKGRYKSIIRLFKKLPDVEYRGEIHEAVFGLEQKRLKTISESDATMYHLDVAINSYQTRKAKVDKREAFLKGSGHAEEYLPEDFNIKDYELPSEDFSLLIKSTNNGINNQKGTCNSI